MKTLKITVEGKTYEVTVEFLDGEEVLLSRPGAQQAAYHVPASSYVSPVAASAPVSAAPVSPVSSASSAGGGGPAPEGAVLSPLSGKIVSVEVEAGAAVNAGDHVITMEAMKMNTLVHAPKAGKVAKILVAPGDAAEEGQLLLVIE